MIKSNNSVVDLKNIIEYLNNNGTEKQYGEAYDEMFDILKEQFMDVPEKEWNETEMKCKTIEDILNV